MQLVGPRAGLNVVAKFGYTLEIAAQGLLSFFLVNLYFPSLCLFRDRRLLSRYRTVFLGVLFTSLAMRTTYIAQLGLQQRLLLVITAAANGAGAVIRRRKEGLNAWEDNDEISDGDVRTSSAFKIEMAHAFLGGDGRIIQIFFSPVFLLYFTIHHFPLYILGSIFLLAF